MELKERDSKHRTIQRYKQLLERVNGEIGHLKLIDVTTENLNNFYLKLGKNGAKRRIKKGAVKGTVEKTDKPLSPQTIQHHARLIHMIFAQAVKEGIVRYNIADTATPPKVIKHEEDFFELEEVLAIREALNGQPLKWQAITSLMIDTGARRGEILGLKWNVIDFKNSQIRIENNLQYTKDRGIFEDTTKTGEARTINIAPEIMSILQAHKKEQLTQKIKLGTYWHDTNYCFTQDNGLPMNPDSINKWLREFSKKYNLPPIHPHRFRHTMASLLYMSGENPIAISKRLGHKQVSTTQNIYAHLLENGDKQASDKIANLLYRNAAK
jgi:integrase